MTAVHSVLTKSASSLLKKQLTGAFTVGILSGFAWKFYCDRRIAARRDYYQQIEKM